MPLALFWTVWVATAFLAAAMLSHRLVGWAIARGALDVPNDRSSHTRATPRGGGLAIVAVTAVAAALVCLLHPESMRTVLGVIGPALAIAIVSWLDDVRSLPNRIRFTVHLAAAAAAAAVLAPVEQLDAGTAGRVSLGAMAWPLTLLWIVGLTNAFNFMDGIDGIAGITAVVAGAAVAVAAAACGNPAVGGLGSALAASAAGFLTVNWQPARIFMGDVGSAFCGFLLAVLPLAASGESEPAMLGVAVAALWPFVFDTAYTLLRRSLRRENIFRAHRSHLYQRLVIAGWSHRAVAALYGLLSAVSGGLAALRLCVPGGRGLLDAAIVATAVLGMLLLVCIVVWMERRSSPRAGTASTAGV